MSLFFLFSFSTERWGFPVVLKRFHKAVEKYVLFFIFFFFLGYCLIRHYASFDSAVRLELQNV